MILSEGFQIMGKNKTVLCVIVSLVRNTSFEDVLQEAIYCS